jgi:hypothetical protein
MGTLKRELVALARASAKVAWVYKLSLNHRDFEHVAIDPRTQRHDVAVHLCIVGRLPRQAISHEQSCAYDHDGEQQQHRRSTSPWILVKNPPHSLLLLVVVGQF